jgi:hypothetical protein
MIERLGLATLPVLEAGLLDLGRALETPPTPDLAADVGARLRARSSSGLEPLRGRAATRRRPVVRSLRRSLLLAAAIALVVVGVALGVGYGLRLLSIEFGTVPSPEATAARSPGAGLDDRVGAALGLGEASDLQRVAARSDIRVHVPDLLGPPDEVYVGGPSLRGQVAFIYHARDDLPPSQLLHRAGLLVTQNAGRFDERLAGKLIGTGTTVEPIDVDGAAGYWIAGQPHTFWYLAPDGTMLFEGERQVGDTLVWERDGVLYRIEGAVDKARALEIARSMRAP